MVWGEDSIAFCSPIPRLWCGGGHACTEFINGFDKASVRFYMGIACVSSSPAEVVLLDLMKDDRLLLHGPRMRGAMVDELRSVCELNTVVWSRRLAFAVVGGKLKMTRAEA